MDTHTTLRPRSRLLCRTCGDGRVHELLRFPETPPAGPLTDAVNCPRCGAVATLRASGRGWTPVGLVIQYPFHPATGAGGVRTISQPPSGLQ